MFLKDSKAADLQGESKHGVWSLDSKTAFLARLSLSSCFLRAPCLLSCSWPRATGRVGSGG